MPLNCHLIKVIILINNLDTSIRGITINMEPFIYAITSSTDILKIENEFNITYIKYILGLRFLASDIIGTILNGKQPRDLSLKQLFDVKTPDWGEI